MGIRETLGGQVEEMLNQKIDEFQAEGVKEKIMAEVEKVVDKYLGEGLQPIKDKLKEVVDLIDGEKDLP